jgi:hypothetical protein
VGKVADLVVLSIGPAAVDPMLGAAVVLARAFKARVAQSVSAPVNISISAPISGW